MQPTEQDESIRTSSTWVSRSADGGALLRPRWRPAGHADAGIRTVAAAMTRPVRTAPESSRPQCGRAAETGQAEREAADQAAPSEADRLR